jgi:hypothetical protein
MKSILSKIVLVLFLVTFSIGFTSAQKGDFVKNMTDEQKASLAQQKEKNAEMKKAFKANLTTDQLAILENAKLSAKEKRDAIKATLTADQKAMMDSNLASVKAERQAFVATLTDAQKANIKKMARKIGREGIKARMLKAKAKG